MEDKYYYIILICLWIISCIVNYLVGYITGFKKSKEIDDKIINNIKK